MRIVLAVQAGWEYYYHWVSALGAALYKVLVSGRATITMGSALPIPCIDRYYALSDSSHALPHPHRCSEQHGYKLEK